MWWTLFIIFLLISIFSSTALFYALKRINQYEDFIIKIQQMIEYSTERMKLVDSKGTFESDDEVGFFFKQLKDIQFLLNDIFETEEIDNAKTKK
mgnify:CR=1 FL=1|tara:strand:- start:32467 stop:32748 length:282 start_codon:yes stop_codon:yes gene_type:complete